MSSPPSNSGTAGLLATLRDRAQQVSFRQAGAGLFVLALLISVPFGGLRPTQAQALAPVRLGEPIDASPVRVEVVRVRYLAPTEDEEEQRIGVVARVTSLTPDRSVAQPVLRDLLRLDKVEGLQASGYSTDTADTAFEAVPGEVVVLVDGQPMGALAPGLTYEVAWLWTLRPEAPSPLTADVVVQSHTYRRTSIEGPKGPLEWRDPTPMARSSITVEQGKP